MLIEKRRRVGRARAGRLQEESEEEDEDPHVLFYRACGWLAVRRSRCGNPSRIFNGICRARDSDRTIEAVARPWNPLLATLIGWALVVAPAHPQDAGDTFRNRSTNPVTGALLGEQREWIWIRLPEATSWQRLIPGRCPQWSPDGKRFYYFLDVGYDGSRAELWSAAADGEARWRVTRSDYFINDGPVVVSPDERSLAFAYWTSRASGDFKDVVVIDLKSHPTDERSEGRVVFRTKSAVDPKSLTWSAADRLSIVVQGVRHDIDATAAGVPQDP